MSTQQHPSGAQKFRIVDSRHPNYTLDYGEWLKWRLTYRGGQQYVRTYLKKIDRQETLPDYNERRELAPIPTFAKSALNDVRNAIFQRMHDIIRRDGSESYQRAVEGLDNGVDLRGSTMNSFMGYDILTELLVMGRCGIYVDSPVISREDGLTPSLADVKKANFRPYLYLYQIEDILSWRCAKPEDPSEFQSLLLRDTCIDFDQDTLLPKQTFERFRLLWIDPNDGLVRLQFLNENGDKIDNNGDPSIEPTVLNLNRIPFVMPDIKDSLLRDVCQHQIALLNLTSRDVAFALKSNFSFYTEQRDLRGVGDHLRHNVNPDGTSEAGGQPSHLKEIKVGLTQGRAYDINSDRPDFIAPPSEPLLASMKLQEKLESDIRRLINLAVSSLATSRQSGASKAFDNQGLEAGLSFIGLVLESAERRIADFWSSYENTAVSSRDIAVVKYPDRYALKADKDRISEASELTELIQQTPSKTARKELWKTITTILLGGRVSVDTMATIGKEIDKSPFTTSDPEMIVQAVESGLVGEETASLALGFAAGEVEKARTDHAARIQRIQAAQTSAEVPSDAKPGARGIRDLAADTSGAPQERASTQSPDLQANRKGAFRGKGKAPKKGDE